MTTEARNELRTRLGRDEWDCHAASAWLLRHYKPQLDRVATERFHRSPGTPPWVIREKASDRISEEIGRMTSVRDIEIALGHWFIEREQVSTSGSPSISPSSPEPKATGVI